MSDSNPGGVMPMIKVPSVEETRNFYVEQLGFDHQMAVVGKDGGLEFCNLMMANTTLMFVASEEAIEVPAAGQTLELYINVEDVDGHFEKVRAAGVEAVEPLTDQWWGDRTFVILDPNGYRVWFYSTVGDVAPPPGMKIV